MSSQQSIDKLSALGKNIKAGSTKIKLSDAMEFLREFYGFQDGFAYDVIVTVKMFKGTEDYQKLFFGGKQELKIGKIPFKPINKEIGELLENIVKCNIAIALTDYIDEKLSDTDALDNFGAKRIAKVEQCLSDLNNAVRPILKTNENANFRKVGLNLNFKNILGIRQFR